MPSLLDLDEPIAPAELHRWKATEYDALVARGDFEDARVELLNGVIFEKMPHNPPHGFAIGELQLFLIQLLGTSWVVRTQDTVALGNSRPEPDLAVVMGPSRLYSNAHPKAGDIKLVIEVSESSLYRDRSRKAAIYAAAKIPIYWIVNLLDKQIEVYTLPRGGKKPQYKSRLVYRIDDDVPVVLDSHEHGTILVKDLIP